MNRLVLLFACFLCTYQLTAQTVMLDPDQTKERIERAQRATVRILVDGNAAGTGFFLSDAGLVATCFHVIFNEQFKTTKTPEGLSLDSSIEIQLFSGEKYPAGLSTFINNPQKLRFCFLNDLIIIGPSNAGAIPPDKIETIPIDQNPIIDLGQLVYTCGYPLGMDFPIFTSGVVSTLVSKPSALDSSFTINSIIIDMTINKGNSGGPLISMGSQPEEDRIIGITTFNINPLAAIATQMKQFVENPVGNFQLGAFSYVDFARLTLIGLESGFYGIGGAHSIEHLIELSK